jgi:SAM-dependent methyltransferase
VIFEYLGRLYPELVKHGGGSVYVAPIAMQFCKGRGLDVGAGKWPLPGAIPVDIKDGGDAMELPHGQFDYVFSSHCLEHLANPVAALEHWRSRLRPGGVLFLYLPSPEMRYWRPEHCRKHLHMWHPQDMAQMVEALGFSDVIHSERDLAYGFSVVGFNSANHLGKMYG